MISAWHLIWILPLSAVIGYAVAVLSGLPSGITYLDVLVTIGI